MTLTERLASLKPEIEQGLVKGVEIDKVINLADYFMHNKKRKPAYLWRVDLYYKRWYSNAKYAKPVFVAEMFNEPVLKDAYEIKKKVYLRRSRNVRVVENWNGKTFKGKAKPRVKYLKIGAVK